MAVTQCVFGFAQPGVDAPDTGIPVKPDLVAGVMDALGAPSVCADKTAGVGVDGAGVKHLMQAVEVLQAKAKVLEKADEEKKYKDESPTEKYGQMNKAALLRHCFDDFCVWSSAASFDCRRASMQLSRSYACLRLSNLSKLSIGSGRTRTAAGLRTQKHFSSAIIQALASDSLLRQKQVTVSDVLTCHCPGVRRKSQRPHQSQDRKSQGDCLAN